VITFPQVHQAGFLISKIQKISQQIFNKMLSENGINLHPGQGRILYVLWKDGDNVPIKDLVKKTGLPKTTLTSILIRLEKEGQIIRKPSTKDRREIKVKLTRKNKSQHETYEKISLEMADLYYKGFSDEEKTQLDHYLNRVLSNLSPG
jgi:DNA-binding MarR family transcriptional regulator